MLMIFTLLLIFPLFGQTKSTGGLASFGGVMGNFGLIQSGKTVINYSGLMAPDSGSYQQHRGNFSTPVWKDGKHSLALSAGWGTLHQNENVVLKEDEIEVPRTLERMEIGGNYSQRLDDQKFFGIRGSLGSAGDRLFYDERDYIFTMSGYYGFPGKKKDRYWFVTVYVSNNNPLLNYVPIPGFIYLYKEENFTGMFGLPFASIQWTPVDPIVVSASFLISTLNLEVAYGSRDKLQTYSGFSIAQQSFLRHDREEDKDRLFLEEKKLFVGMRSPATKFLSGDLQFGQSFDRVFFEGRNFRDRESGEGRIPNSWYGQLSLNISY